MKKYISSFVVLCLITAGVIIYPHLASASCGNGFSYCRQITLNLATYNPGSQSNFTVLVCANGASPCNTSVGGLNQSGGGAHVQNSNGYDIVFTSDAGCTTDLNWEKESYVASTGEMEMWVLVTSLGTSNQSIYMCYGNSSISTFQGGATGSAWNTNYKAIYHLPNGSTFGLNDSTSFGNTAVAPASNGGANPATATTGQIDGGAAFVAATQQTIGIPISDPSFGGSSNGTVSWWAYNSNAYNYSGETFWWASNTSGELSAQNYFGTLYVGWNKTGDQRITVTSSSANYPQNTWTYYTFTWVSGGTSTLYVNGSSIGTHASTAVGNTSGSIILGSEQSIGGFYSGSMDEWRIANTNFSANWITTEYNNQSAPSTFETFGSESSNTVVAGTPLLQLTNVSLKITNAKLKIIGN
jgi:hypothetical protein